MAKKNGANRDTGRIRCGYCQTPIEIDERLPGRIRGGMLYCPKVDCTGWPRREYVDACKRIEIDPRQVQP